MNLSRLLKTALAALVIGTPAVAQDTSSQARHLEVKGEIGAAMARRLERQLKAAENDPRVAVILIEVDTPGGAVDAMQKISGDLLRLSKPSVAAVRNAFSAGALIAMSAEKLVMLPGSSIGAALPITATGQELTGNVGEKINSALRSEFRAVAEERGRPPELAEGMVNPALDLPGIKPRGQILTLSAARALEFKLADARARDLEGALAAAGYKDLALAPPQLTPADRFADFITRPWVAGLLLAIGVLGLIAELSSPGFGVPGLLGILGLGLYFLGPWMGGDFSLLALALVVVGILLILAELFVVPGFGIAGVAGLGALLGSAYLIYPAQFGTVAATSVLVFGAGAALLLFVLPRTRLARPFILRADLSRSSPMSVSTLSAPPLVTERGRTVTDLRPAGIAEIGGQRHDVVSEGRFLPAGTEIEVVLVEGSRIVVRPISPHPSAR
ncbi:membrane-bound serine protease (ClpP class) [Deinobacterium chartae]|uniref:Membrane-bound serine protease (ClpP class) n=1 Tax=Deinobacterium chartae TaxID=521158 RepID=A0A841I084_9DEIO|nr:NfeD family protein [Deinobacterium chartae]MBB6098374.1 membrane-bound serine protease (ClpP class) [Deinobacterium chartae]